MQCAVKGLDGVEVAGEEAGVDCGCVHVLSCNFHLRRSERRIGYERFQMCVAKAQHFLLPSCDVYEQAIALHFCGHVVDSEDVFNREVMVDERAGTVVAALPVSVVDVCKVVVVADPWRGLEELEVGDEHFLEED